MVEQRVEDRYCRLLEACVEEPDEACLLTASDLGRELVRADIPVEEIAELHERALTRLARENPDLRLVETARNISAPLMEVMMAYGMAFRERMEALRLANERLGHSEEKYRSLVENVNVGVYRATSGGELLHANPALACMLGFDSPRSLMAVPTTELYDDPADRQRFVAEIRAEGTVRRRELRLRDKGGALRYLSCTASAQMGPGGEFLWIDGVLEDVTDLRQAELDRRRLEQAVEQVTESVMITDTEGRIEYVNPAAEAITGYGADELLGETPRIFQSGKQSARFYRELWETITGGEPWKGVMVNRRKDGTEFEEEATITPVHDADGRVVNYVGVKRDVTRERELERELRQAQKLEAVGRLAGGVAHDFNNLLMVILGQGQLMLARLAEGDPARFALEEICQAGERAAGLTRQLLAFSRKQVLEPRVLGLNRLVEDLAKMLRRLIGEDVRLSTVLRPDLGRVRVDPGQIEQVLLNLAVNARDAMPRGGELTVETDNVEVSPDRAERGEWRIDPGPYVRLVVSDTGVGMGPDVISHIFEPFFTTKGAGKGTGLGLSTVYGIVKQSGGFILVYSEPDRGTAFKIYLPRVEAGEDHGVDTIIDAPEAPGGTETILVAEDDPGVRTTVVACLSRCGYQVLEAADPCEALQVAEAHPGPVALLVTDVVMPGADGPELVERLRTVRPHTRVLFMSGYTEGTIAHHGVRGGGMAFLQKPFSPLTLAQKVREVLDL